LGTSTTCMIVLWGITKKLVKIFVTHTELSLEIKG